jgi:hypothetical protein
MQFSEQGRGIAADARLVRVNLPIAEMATTLWMLLHPDLKRVARIRAVVDFIVPALGR